MRAVTSTTEEIKAKISNDVWDRQRRWEMKRDILFETGRKISADYSAFGNALGFFNQEIAAKMEKSALDQKKVEVMTDFHKASLEVDGMFALVGVVCAQDVVGKIFSFSQDVRTTMLAIRGADRESDDAIFARLGPKYAEVVRTLRRELEAPPVA